MTPYNIILLILALVGFAVGPKTSQGILHAIIAIIVVFIFILKI